MWPYECLPASPHPMSFRVVGTRAAATKPALRGAEDARNLQFVQSGDLQRKIIRPALLSLGDVLYGTGIFFWHSLLSPQKRFWPAPHELLREARKGTVCQCARR